MSDAAMAAAGRALAVALWTSPIRERTDRKRVAAAESELCQGYRAEQQEAAELAKRETS
jgi:hypothetical protein